MTIQSLLHQRCTIIHRAAEPGDRWNTPVLTVTTIETDVACRLQRRGTRQGIAESKELLVNRDTSTSEWKLFLLPDQDVSQYDQVVEGGRTFEVVGHEYAVPTPTTESHHLEVLLRLVTG